MLGYLLAILTVKYFHRVLNMIIKSALTFFITLSLITQTSALECPSITAHDSDEIKADFIYKNFVEPRRYWGYPSHRDLMIGKLSVSEEGLINDRPEIQWLKADFKFRKKNSYIGKTSVNVEKAYKFTGQILNDDGLKNVKDIDIEIEASCTDSCKENLPYNKSISFAFKRLVWDPPCKDYMIVPIA